MKKSLIEHIIPAIHVEPWPMGALVLPKIQNHRGLHINGVVENSIEAFRKARELGGLCSELDVRLSRDKIPMVYHDESLLRLNGRSDKISDLTSSELKNSLNIPSLQQVLSHESLTPFFNIEIKSNLIDDCLPRKTVEVIRQLRAEARVMFSSFNPASLFLLQNLCPEIPRALLASAERSDENKWYLRHLLLAPFLRLCMLNLDKDMLSDKVIEVLKKNKIPFSVWTVNDEQEVHKFLRVGASSIITDLAIS